MAEQLRSCRGELAVAEAARQAAFDELGHVQSDLNRILDQTSLSTAATSFRIGEDEVLVEIDRGSCHGLRQGKITLIRSLTIRIVEVDCTRAHGVVLRDLPHESLNDIVRRILQSEG